MAAPEGHADRAESTSYQLPQGTKPCGLELVRGLGIAIAVGHLERIDFPRFRHPQWRVAVQFTPAETDFSFRPPGGKTRKRRVSGDQVFVLPPESTYAFGWRKPADLILLLADPDWVCCCFPRLRHKPAIIVLERLVAARPEIARLCAALRPLQPQPQKKANWRMAALGTLLGVLIFEALLALSSGELKKPVGHAGRIMEKIDGYLAKHNNEQVTVKVMTGNIGISPRHLRRIVQQATGMGPHEYVMVKKTEYAVELLEKQGLNVNEAADRAGFSNPLQLRRHLRKKYGSTPSAFKLRHLRPPLD